MGYGYVSLINIYYAWLTIPTPLATPNGHAFTPYVIHTDHPSELEVTNLYYLRVYIHKVAEVRGRGGL